MSIFYYCQVITGTLAGIINFISCLEVKQTPFMCVA